MRTKNNNMRTKNNFLFIFVIFILFTTLFLSILFVCNFDKFSDKFVKYMNESFEKKSKLMNKQRELLTLDNFKSVSAKFGYKVENIEDFDIEHVKILTVAKKYDHKIELYTTEDNEGASNLFNLHKEEFEKMYEEADNPENPVTRVKGLDTGENYDYCVLQIRNDYMIIYRVNNNFLYLKSDISNKKKIEELLDELGCYNEMSFALDSAFEALGKCFKDFFGLSPKSSEE